MDVRGIVLLGCLTGALAAPLSSSNQCERKCIAPSGFISGRTYLYSYETEMATFIQQEEYGYSNLTISCVVNLEVIGNCEIVLELSDISAQETNRDGSTITSPNEASFMEHLTRDRLRFGMQAGKVTSVCPSPDEAVWVTNFKRGVLSALQLTQPTQMHEWETVTESTVSGKCPTFLLSEEEGRLTKWKDFKKCEGRYHNNVIIPGIKLVPYAPSTDAITSQQHCRQEHNGGYMTYSECREKHTLFPIAEPPTGPITTVIQRLTFNRIIKAPSNHRLESISERKSILFEKSDHMEEGKTDPSRANALVADLCQSLSVGVDSDTARLYTAVIHEMRRLDSRTLANVFAVAAVGCDVYQDTLMALLGDALRDCKSTGCVRVMVNLIKDNTVEDTEVISSWISSLDFVNHPTNEMVAHLMELKDIETIRKPLLLTVTSIIRNYCTHVNEDCEDEEEISQALTEFENRLGSRCRYQSKEEKREMLFFLHVLGNAGIYTRSIKKCYESENTDISLRVAAMQAVQQMPCKSKDQDGLITILKKSSQDSELRISAYKALMSCPSQDVLDVIDELLEDEMSNQVGGYIVSHLKGIQESQDPLKADLRALLQDHQITAKFLDDPTKFSQNSQWSWYNETTGYGLGAEGDVIFSSQSFIPRQLGVKGRFDAFGYAFEAFELGGRVEGLQRVLESAFGFKDEHEDEDGGRNRRSLIKENKLENVIDDFEVTEDGEPDGHVYLKMFDREVFFLDTEDIKQMMTPRTPEDKLIEIALWSVGKTYEVSNGQVVAEHKLSIPLVNGLEMKMSVNASAIERMKVTGKLDILSLMIDPKSMEIDGTIEPSASFDMSCLMEVDAHCARIGTNYELSAHTATTISGKIAFEDGKNLKVQLRSPEQKQELLSVSSKVYFIHQEEKNLIPASSLRPMQDTVCTGDHLKNAIGIQVCGESMYHVDEYGMPPMSGAYEFILTAENVEGDSTIFDLEASYSLEKQSRGEEVEKTDTFHLMFGSRDTQRMYVLDWTFNRLTRQFTAELDCPHITSRLEVNSIREANHKRLDVTYTVYEDSVYSLYLDLERSYEDNGDSNYYPTMGMSTPQFGSLELVGSVLNSDSVVRLDVSLGGETRTFISVNGDITKIRGNKKSLYNTNLSIGGEYIEAASISSEVQVKDQVVTVDATLSKDSLFGTRSVTISGKHSSRGARDINHDFYLSCAFSHSPESNFRFDGEFQFEDMTERLDSRSNFKFCYGQTSCSGPQKLLLSHHLNVEHRENSPLTNSLTVTLQHPIQGTHLVLSQEMLVDDGLKNFSIQVIDERPSPAAVLVGSQVGLIHDKNDEGRFGSFEISLSTPGSIKRLNQTWSRQSSDVDAVTTIQWQEDQQMVASVSYAKPSDSNDLLSCSLTLPDMSTYKLVHSCSRYEKSHVEQMMVTSDDQPVFSVAFTGNRSSPDSCMESWSLTVNTPFHVLSDFMLDYLDKSDDSGLDSTVAFTFLPEGSSYSLNVAGKKEQLPEANKMTGRLVLSAPSSAAAFKMFVEEKHLEFKTGVSLITMSDGSDEKIFGIEAKFVDQSDETGNAIFVRVNTTTPSHEDHAKQVEKAMELTANLQEDSFDCSLDIEYHAGKHAVASVSLQQKTNDAGFIFQTSLNAPFHKGAITLDHSKSGESLFNPHLTIHVASPDVDMTLLDVNFRLSTSHSIYGKDHEFELQVSGPEKTIILTTGLERKTGGFDYFIQVANQEEVRLRIDLDTFIQVEGSFSCHIGLNASSIYAPEWPISCGVSMGMGQEGIGGILFFDVNEENLFHLNVSKSVTNDLPYVLNKENVAVRVKLPTSVIPSLHHFGMSILKEESLSQLDFSPIQSSSLSFFWGPETDQQLTISLASSVQDTGDSHSVEGSLLLVQPLRTVHLQPEYNFDYSFSMDGPQLTMKLEFDHGDSSDSGSSLEITHSKHNETGNVTFSTSATASLHGGKMFTVAHNVNCPRKGKLIGNLVFTMTDGDHEEEARFSYSGGELSDESLSHAYVLNFHHLPSELQATSIIGIDNGEQLMDFTAESQCFVPNLKEPINLGVTLSFHKLEKELVLHGLGPVNDITVRANVFNLTSDGVSSYRLETNNDINGVKQPVNIQLNFNKDFLDVICETNSGEDKLHSSYLNDSAIQTTLTKNNVVNAQHTISILDPFTLYNLITWDTEWPARVKEAFRVRINEMGETCQRTLDKYQEIKDTIQEGTTTYMTHAMMRNGELVEQMIEVGDGLKERFSEIKENYLMQRETIRGKFEEFGQRAKANLSPLVAEYEVMFEEGRSNLRRIREHVDEMTELYFEETKIDIEAKLLSVIGQILAEYEDAMYTLMENVKLDREMISDLKEEKKAHMKQRVESEINWMAERWEEAQEDVQLRWRAFADSMTGLINYEELENMKLGLQLSPMYQDFVRLVNTVMDQVTDVTGRLEELREQRAEARYLKEQDLNALRQMGENFEMVKNAPTFATREVHLRLLNNFFESASWEFNEKLERLVQWAEEQTKGYKYLANIEDGKIEVWLYTDQRFDDLVSPPVNDPLRDIKILGMRLAEDFPLIEDMRRFKSQLYNDSELIMAYFHDVAEVSYNEFYNPAGNSLQLRDLWEWHGFINEALCDMLATRAPNGEAILMGNQHYKTFDGTYYAYAGKCSFLLAQDFVDNNFTIAVEYERKDSQSGKFFTIIAGEETFEIRDGRVSVNNRLRELPYSSSEVLITRDSSTIHIKGHKGFEVWYDMVHDIFKTQVSIFYFGKTAGLFGNFNYEPNDDLEKSSNEVTERIDEFARSWEIGRKCDTHLDKSVTCPDSPSLNENYDCAVMFLDGLGAASTGHPAVNPEPFYKACVNSECGKSNMDRLEARCNVFQGYIEACKHQGLVWLDMPEECVRCPASEGDGLMWSGYSTFNVEGVDIVVILEQESCMEASGQEVRNLIRKVDAELGRGESPLTENRFGLVGFGGASSNNEAHIETIKGELFGTMESFILRLEDLQYDGEGMGDVWGAIDMAMGYPFRPGVPKHIVLLSCSKCTERSRSSKSLRLQRAMQEAGVTFSVFIDHSFKLVPKFERKEDNKIYGFDESRVFTDKLAGVSRDFFKGDASLHDHLIRPSNPCIRLATATSGGVFSMDSMQSKAFKDVFALWLSKHSDAAEMSSCYCAMGKNGVPQSICEPFWSY